MRGESRLVRHTMSEPEVPAVPHDSFDRVNFLELRNTQLAEAIKRVESERHYMEAEILRLQREVKRLKTELDRLRYPPLIVGSVRDVLTDGRVIVKSSTGPDFVVNSAETVEHGKITVGSRVALNKQTLAVMGVLPASLDPLVTASEIVDKPSITYQDIGGLGDQIREIREAVEYPLLRADLYKKVGVDPPKGVLLIGSPGTGKTMIAKAVAHHTNATFVRLVGSELVQKYIGEGARLVRELFQLARDKAPTIIFIDEVDSIGAKRLEVATSGDREVQRTLMQLLAEMDGFEPLANVKIIAATNRRTSSTMPSFAPDASTASSRYRCPTRWAARRSSRSILTEWPSERRSISRRSPPVARERPEPTSGRSAPRRACGRSARSGTPSRSRTSSGRSRRSSARKSSARNPSRCSPERRASAGRRG